jgi:hypothetical protein
MKLLRCVCYIRPDISPPAGRVLTTATWYATYQCLAEACRRVHHVVQSRMRLLIRALWPHGDVSPIPSPERVSQRHESHALRAPC